MRLTQDEVTSLAKAAEEFIGKNHAELRLFGSRTDSQAKGGDIDLLLLTFDSETNRMLSAQKHSILARMKELIGDQRIDLKIAQECEINSDAFLQIIYPKSLVLKKWP